MQKIRLPITLDPVRSAQKRLDFVGVYPVQALKRLAESVVSIDSEIDVNFSCNIDKQGLTVIDGHASVSITMLCERCLQSYPHVIDISYCFSPVKRDEQAEALPEDYEPIFVDEFGEVNLVNLIEDELILALPIVPVHEYEHCEVSEANRVFGEIPEENDKPNPFAILASLKHK